MSRFVNTCAILLLACSAAERGTFVNTSTDSAKSVSDAPETLSQSMIADDPVQSLDYRITSSIIRVYSHSKSWMTLASFCQLLGKPNSVTKLDLQCQSNNPYASYALFYTSDSTAIDIRLENKACDGYVIHLDASESVELETVWRMIQGERPTNFTHAVGWSNFADALAWDKPRILRIEISVIKGRKETLRTKVL